MESEIIAVGDEREAGESAAQWSDGIETSKRSQSISGLGGSQGDDVVVMISEEVRYTYQTSTMFR